MIKKTDLSGLYNGSLFNSMKDSFIIKEKDPCAKICQVKFVAKGADFILSTEDLFSSSENLYTKKSEDFHFRRKCDGFVICEYNGQGYLIWIEIKSSFNEVFSDAIYQISGCYIKAKSYLNSIISFSEEEYKEFGIVVSLPDSGVNELSNPSLLKRKRSVILGNDTVEDIYRRQYRQTHKITLKGDDFGMSNIALSPSIQLSKLPIVHISETLGSSVQDLTCIIKSVFP